MHYYKSNNEIMQYCSFSNDIALIMHYRALLKRSVYDGMNHSVFNNFYDIGTPTVQRMKIQGTNHERKFKVS